MSKAPSPPDPYQVSAAQTQSNQQTAAYEASLNRVNQVTPFGSSTWNGTGPGATQTVTLDPMVEQNLRNQFQQDSQLSNIGFHLGDQASATLDKPIDTSGLPALSSGPGMFGGMQSNLNFSGAPAVSTDFSGDAQRASDAVYNQAASRLDPQWQNNQHDLDAKLANQGVVQGSEAYNRAQDELSRQKNDAYNQANYSAVGAGNDLQNQRFGQSLAARGQAVGEQEASGNFTNNAQAQAYAQALQSGQFANNARAQGLTEATQLRTLPLNELNALRSQTQVQNPQFQQVAPVGVSPTNVSSNVWQGYNAQVANANNAMNGLFGLGSAAITAFSDRRLKRNLKRIGTTPRDRLPVYEFSYRGSRKRHVGVMAQHVARIRPEAIVQHPSGFLMVDYGQVA